MTQRTTDRHEASRGLFATAELLVHDTAPRYLGPLTHVADIRPHSIILASCKPGCKPGRRLACACRKQVESRSQASWKLASNLLQTKSMLAAMKKLKHSTWVKQYIRDRHRYDAYSIMLPEMKANDMSRYVGPTVISGWTSVHCVP